MTQPDDNHLPARRRGFLASMADGLMPQIGDDDDDGPVIAPGGVKTASVLAMLGGLVYLVFYGMALVQLDTIVAQARENYQQTVENCTSRFGGFGTAAVTQTDVTGTAAACRTLPDLSASYWTDSYHGLLMTVSIIYVLIGIALVASGWFLRLGRGWSRRVLIAVAIVTVLGSLLLGLTNLYMMIASLLILIALFLSYFGSGGRYFLRVKARRHT